MLIEFKIQLDDSGGTAVTQASANANAALPAQKQLNAAYVPNSIAAGKPGGAAPLGDPGTGAPAAAGGAAPLGDPGTGRPSVGHSPGSGTVFVIGPIVIHGSGAQTGLGGATALGGAAPLGDPGTGTPAGGAQASNPVIATAAPATKTKRR